MTHEEYIKKRDNILHLLYRDGQAHPDPRYAVGDYVAEAAQAIDALVLEVIGEDITHWTDHWGQEHNVLENGHRERNSLMDTQRRIVTGGKS